MRLGGFLRRETAMVKRTAREDGEQVLERTWAEQALEKVEALLLDMSEDSASTLTIGENSYTFESRSDLLAFRARLKWEVSPPKSIRVGRTRSMRCALP